MSPGNDNQQTAPASVYGLGGVLFVDAAAEAMLSRALGVLDDPGSAGWERVKYNASRTVWRGSVGGQLVYVKHFHHGGAWRRFLGRLRGSEAAREMQFAQHLRASGVPTTPVLAARVGGRTEWLATLAVAPAVTAKDWHARQLSAGPSGQRAIQRAIRSLATIIGRMHAAGVIHNDLHCGNILVRTAGDEPELFLTDLHRASRSKRLSRRARAANLAHLFHDRRELTTRTERVRFLRQYLSIAPADGSLAGWQVLIERAARRHRRRLYNQRDRRIFGLNRYFTPLKLPGGWRGQAVLASKRVPAGSTASLREYTSADWQKALGDVESLFVGPGAEVRKDTRSGLVVRRKMSVGGHELDVFIKRPRRKHAWKVLIDCFRSSRPVRAFAMGHALLARGVATALPMACMERRVGPVLLDSILITETVCAPRLDEFLNTWLGNPPRGDAPLTVAQQRHLAQQVLWQMGRMLQRLHDNNFAHRDLKAANMLVHWKGTAAPAIVLLDLDGLWQPAHLTTRRRFQGLMSLNVSLLKCPVVNHAGQLRMLLGYLRRPGSGRINFKPFWRVLEQWSAKKLQRQINSRRRRQKATRRPGA